MTKTKKQENQDQERAKMNVEIVSREFIKPSTPTPPSICNYKISLFDELSPSMNVPLILYYPANEKSNIVSKCLHLKNSLAKTLTRFYPLAGRYVKEERVVDCSDQGAEFVEARVDGLLDDLFDKGRKLEVHLLNDFVPLPLGAIDEIIDPLLAVQVNIFGCGGLAIGLSVSHRVADMSSICTFLKEWATVAGGEDGVDTTYPIFNSASFFPPKGVPSGLPLAFPRTKEDIKVHKIVTKMFPFNKKAISRIRDMARPQDSSKRVPSRVQSLFGMMGKALVDMATAEHDHTRDFVIVQTVNIRERVVPPLPKHQFGSLLTIATSLSRTDECGIELQSLVDVLSDSVSKSVENCGKMLSNCEDGQVRVLNPVAELAKTISNPEVFVAGLFTSWSRFSFYEADFGWGKPIWVSSANMPIRNNVTLIDDKLGDGIEAWVSLDEKDMPIFEQDCNIKDFTT